MLSAVDEIKEKLDIVQVISEYLQLKKVGSNFRALCPFHSEKNPSFYVSPSRQIFKCFGCQASGDIFKFIMLIEGTEFKEALGLLAKKAGVELKPEPKEKKTERQRLYEICEIATSFFALQLKKTKIGKEAQNYLLGRGILKESTREWRLGYAPNTWRGLSDFLVGRGYKREEIVKAGLAIKPEGESITPYDRFRGRIMFPIFDLHGNVIGFGGRIREDKKEKIKSEKGEEPAKYINTPNTLIYDKSRVLYGLNQAKMEIRNKDTCILVEGYTDVILSHQAGIKNVIATSGTALTPYQLKILSRYTKNLLLAFDMDIAGQEATKRGIDLAQVLGFNIKIIFLPSDKDPADIVKENPERWQRFVFEAKDIIEFYFKKAFTQFDKKRLEGKKGISQLLLPFIARLQNRIEQSYWVKELTKELDVEESAIWEEVNKVARAHSYPGYELPEISQPLAKIVPIPKSQKRQIEERLLMLLLCLNQEPPFQDIFLKYQKEVKELPQISFKEGQKLLQFIFSGISLKKASGPVRNRFLNGAGEFQDFISELQLQSEVEKTFNDEFKENLGRDIQFCIARLKKIHQEEKLKEIIQKLKRAEGLKDKKKVSALLKELKRVKSQ